MPKITVHYFGACELDETRRELRRDGETVRLGPRVLDLLILLVRQSHRVVAHGEICATVWPGQRISDAAMHACVSRARAAIGDHDDDVPMIRTFTRYGYRFVGAVRSEVETTRDRSDPTPTVRLPDPPPGTASTAGLYGRSVELRTLSAALDEALAGRGTLAVVRGEYGSGKTRLAEEVARLAAAHGMEVLSGHCVEPDDPPSFWPWAQIVRRYAAQHDPDAIRAAFGSATVDVARIAPALRDRCPELADAPPVDPDQARLRVHESLLGFVARTAAVEPLLIVVDDVQWADAGSLRVLEALAAELSRIGAVVLALVEAAGDETPPVLATDSMPHTCRPPSGRA